MQYGINLLKTPAQKPKGLGIPNKVKILLILMLVVYVVIAMGLVSFSYTLTLMRNRIKDESQGLEAKIKGFQKLEIMAVALKERMEKTDKLLSEREKIRLSNNAPAQLITKIQDLVIPGITVETVTTDIGNIEFAGQADNVAVLNDFIKSLKDTSYWLSVKLSSLSRNDEGIYDFTITANNKK